VNAAGSMTDLALSLSTPWSGKLILRLLFQFFRILCPWMLNQDFGLAGPAIAGLA
jgi:hypothetical protein